MCGLWSNVISLLAQYDLLSARSTSAVRLTSYKLQATRYKPQVISYTLQGYEATHCKLQATRYKLPATSYKLQVDVLEGVRRVIGRPLEPPGVQVHICSL